MLSVKTINNQNAITSAVLGLDGNSNTIVNGNLTTPGGFDIVGDPSLQYFCNSENSLPQVLERYWRWYAGKDELFGLKTYLKSIIFSVRVLAWEDLRAGEPWTCFISLIVPHYQLWRHLSKRRSFLNH